MPNHSVEPENILCLLSFTEDGTVRWSTSIGNSSQDFIQRMVHIFRASLSISSAFLSVTNDTTVPDDSSEVKHPDGRRNERATLVKLENDIAILAKYVHQSSDTWFALIGRPLVLRGDTVRDEVLNALEELARTLFPLAQEDQEDLYQLCDSISKSLTSTLFWNDKGRIMYLMDSLVKFCNKQNALRKEQQQNKSAHSDPISYSSMQTELKQSLGSFHTEISRQFDASHVTVCIFCADLKPFYAEKLRQREIDLLGWYFSTCVNRRFRAFSNIFYERDNRGMVHVWHKRRGLILFTNFLSTKWDGGNSSRLFQHAGDALIDAASCAIV